MNSQCPPCSCLEGAAQSNPCSASAPEQNSQVDPCQDLCPPCPCGPPELPLGVTSPALPAGSGPCLESGKIPSCPEEPFTIETPGMCVMRFPLQKSILTVELCPPDPPAELGDPKTAGTSLENLEKLSQEFLSVALEPCTLEVLELGEASPAQGAILGDPCTSQSGISLDPCASQSGICLDPCTSPSGISLDPCASQSAISSDSCASQSGISSDPCTSQSGISSDPCASQTGISMDPCASQSAISADPCASQSQGLGDAKDSASQTSPRIPFRLNSCTSSIVERCLSRCQGWFRGKQ